MNKKTLAIHSRHGSFSDRWIEYCNIHNISFKLVDCTSTTIIDDISDVQGLLWHWNHASPVDHLLAKQVLSSAQLMGVTVFPDWNTCWHFDDKVAQKYLLESIGAPLVPSYVFYDSHKALIWLESAEYPLVFKLRGGAGSQNVFLAKNINQARKLCNTAFGCGFKPVAGYMSDYKTKLRKTRTSGGFLSKLYRFPSVLRNIAISNKMLPVQRGYAYFQKFMPHNEYDTRITIIGNRAFGFRRFVRPGDFRASGSGLIDYTPEKVDADCIHIAFEVAGKMGAQSLAFDFAYDHNRTPRIIEISYCFMAGAIAKCPGYWDSLMNWHSDQCWPQDAILDDLLLHITK